MAGDNGGDGGAGGAKAGGGVRWEDWGKTAFQQAAREQKPILLDISAVWCHWCHVMDDTTYSDPAVVARIARDFVPVRVDNDRRPDINSRYNMGGWPTTAFLTPEGDILTGATYVPPEAMADLLDQVAAFYRDHREELESGEGMTAEEPTPTRTRTGISRVQALSAVEEVASRVAQAYDPEFGGFGSAPKFPHTKALELLLVRHLRGGSGSPSLDVLAHTLRAMRGGGMYDHVDGGFFRYSTTRDWSIPHYEKMLEDNAELLRLYARVARMAEQREPASEPEHGQDLAGLCLGTVRDVTRFLVTWLRSPEGYFYGSQDADEVYYRLDEAERRRREFPRVDRTLYTGWNALVASGFLEAYLATRDERLRETGLVTLEYLWGVARLADGRLAHFCDDDGPHGPVLLEDHASLALALLDAWESAGERSYLDRAGDVLQAAAEIFGDAKGNGFCDTAVEGDEAGHLRLRRKGLAENARLALAELRYADTIGQIDPAATAEPGGGAARRARAARALAHFRGVYPRYGIMAADYALAADWWTGPTARVEVRARAARATGAEDPASSALRFEAAAAVAAARVLGLPGEAAGETVDRAEGGQSGHPLALVCSGDRCLAPISDPTGVAEGIREASSRLERGGQEVRRSDLHDHDHGPQTGAPQ